MECAEDTGRAPCEAVAGRLPAVVGRSAPPIAAAVDVVMVVEIDPPVTMDFDETPESAPTAKGVALGWPPRTRLAPGGTLCERLGGDWLFNERTGDVGACRVEPVMPSALVQRLFAPAARLRVKVPRRKVPRL